MVAFVVKPPDSKWNYIDLPKKEVIPKSFWDSLLFCYENVWCSLFKISSKTDLGQPMLIRI